MIQLVAVYDPHMNFDYDGENAHVLGYSTWHNQDRATLIFTEMIRDAVSGNNNPFGPFAKNGLDQTMLGQRVVAHESLHRFLGTHGVSTSITDSGIMDPSNALDGTYLPLLLALQVRSIAIRDMSR